MTNKEFFANASEGILTNDMIIYAQAQMLKYAEANKQNRKVAVADDGVSIDDLRRQILEIVNSSDGVLAKDMAKQIGVTSARIGHTCANLEKEGLIVSAPYKERNRAPVNMYFSISSVS
jgi:DNA-binding MarR family transcriptional regulator